MISLKSYRLFVWLWLLALVLFLGMSPQKIKAQNVAGNAASNSDAGNSNDNYYSYRTYVEIVEGRFHATVVTFRIDSNHKGANQAFIDISRTCHVEGNPAGVQLAKDHATFDGTAFVTCTIPAWEALFPEIPFPAPGTVEPADTFAPAFGAAKVRLEPKASGHAQTVWSLSNIEFAIAEKQTHLSVGAEGPGRIPVLSSNPFNTAEPVLAFSGVNAGIFVEQLAIWDGPDKFLYDQEFIDIAQKATDQNAALAWVKGTEPLYSTAAIPALLVLEREQPLYIGGKPGNAQQSVFTLYNVLADPGPFKGTKGP